jgi:hypothetical protein
MTVVVRGLACALLLAGCATAPPQRMAWQRTDGKVFSNEQLQADTAFCDGEVSKAGLSDSARASRNYGIGDAMFANESLKRVAVGCMAGRGYILVPAN